MLQTVFECLAPAYRPPTRVDVRTGKTIGPSTEATGTQETAERRRGVGGTGRHERPRKLSGQQQHIPLAAWKNVNVCECELLTTLLKTNTRVVSRCKREGVSASA